MKILGAEKLLGLSMSRIGYSAPDNSLHNDGSLSNIEISKKRFILVLAISVVVFIGGCTFPSPERNFSDEDLLITVSDMPEGWEEAEFIPNHPYSKEGAENRALRNFYFSPTAYLVKSGETIYHYRSQSSAKRGYTALQQLYMAQNPRVITPWETPQGFGFAGSTASQWRFACTYSTFSPAPSFGNKSRICQFVAQYEEFVINFGVTVEVDGDQFIALEDVADIIEIIEQKMEDALK